MNKFEIEKPISGKENEKIEMYLNPKTAENFAQREKEDTEEHSVVSGVIENIAMEIFVDKEIKMANLGAGANPQKYEKILEKTKNGSELDWVDISPKMLEIASKEINQSENIHFIENNFTGYLNSKEDNSLDCVIMQYSINYIDDIKDFFEILSKKLNTGGAFIANLGAKSLENNKWASFLINGQEFSGRKNMVSGDHYTIKFLNPDGTVFASTEKNFFSNKEMLSTPTLSELKTEIKTIKGFEILIVKK
jgi:ubiquinone/menaquinone biosynthesis C-methylase UbiE